MKIILLLNLFLIQGCYSAKIQRIQELENQNCIKIEQLKKEMKYIATSDNIQDNLYIEFIRAINLIKNEVDNLLIFKKTHDKRWPDLMKIKEKKK